MIFSTDQTLNDSTKTPTLERESVTENFSETTVDSYENLSLTNKIAHTLQSDSFEFFNYLSNYLGNIALNLQSECIESSFEFKILTTLLIVLISILVAITIAWKIYGKRIDHFYRHQGMSYFKISVFNWNKFKKLFFLR